MGHVLNAGCKQRHSKWHGTIRRLSKTVLSVRHPLKALELPTYFLFEFVWFSVGIAGIEPEKELNWRIQGSLM